MDDIISRQAAIDALAKFVPYAICDESTESYTNGLTDAYNLICQLPSAQQWIPCSERMPEKPGKYLVTVKNGNVYAGTFDVISGKFQCAATAWMPLPEPWRGEGHG